MVKRGNGDTTKERKNTLCTKRIDGVEIQNNIHVHIIYIYVCIISIQNLVTVVYLYSDGWCWFLGWEPNACNYLFGLLGSCPHLKCLRFGEDVFFGWHG